MRQADAALLLGSRPRRAMYGSMATSSSTPRHLSEDKKSFAALRVAGARTYLALMGLVMMADSIEHVISYWVIFQVYDSPVLAGFAVISHWAPFLLFSVHVGALADRYDPRRLIQIGIILFIVASLGWALLLLVGGLAVWHVVVLLLIHGIAGVFWVPVAQVLMHDVVEAPQLPSAVRLLAMSRMLGLLLGPVVGGIMLIVLGSWQGLLVNALFYIPALLWLVAAPYGPKFRATPPPPVAAIRGFTDIWETLRIVARDPTLRSMTALAGIASFFVGNSYQAQMPAFAAALGQGETTTRYSVLLGANAAGAVVGGLILEWRGMLPPQPHTAFILVALWCVTLIGFSATTNYYLALVLLFIAGFLFLAHAAMTQALVQLHAPAAIRGRVIGIYSMSAMGLMSFSGITVGLGGSLVGVHWSLAASAIVLVICTLMLAPATLRARSPAYAGLPIARSTTRKSGASGSYIRNQPKRGQRTSPARTDAIRGNRSSASSRRAAARDKQPYWSPSNRGPDRLSDCGSCVLGSQTHQASSPRKTCRGEYGNTA